MGLGDDIMLVGEARELRKTDPRLVAAAHGRSGYRVSPVFLNNPHMAPTDQVRAALAGAGRDRFQWLDENAGRRYRAFETIDRRFWTAVGPTRGDLFLTAAERAWAANAVRQAGLHNQAFTVIEPHLKPRACPNKDWGFDRYQEVVELASPHSFVQLIQRGQKPLRSCAWIKTPDFRHAAAVLQLAAAAVLPEGGLHHAAAALGVRAVVIFGGYISPVQTGYPEHVNLFTGGEPCGWRKPCAHCRAAMDAIAPEQVAHELQALLANEQVSA